MQHGQRYEPEAARAAILFVAPLVIEPTFHKVCKVFYFAELLHLERYGSMMFGDVYKALDNGPVPSFTHMEMSEVRRHPELSLQTGYRVENKMVRGTTYSVPVIVPIRDPDMDELSVSMLECLGESAELCREQTYDELCELSHDAAWRKARESGRTTPMPDVFLAEFLPHSAELVEYLNDPYPGDANEMMRLR